MAIISIEDLSALLATTVLISLDFSVCSWRMSVVSRW
jgi:hypothetical protein